VLNRYTAFDTDRGALSPCGAARTDDVLGYAVILRLSDEDRRRISASDVVGNRSGWGPSLRSGWQRIGIWPNCVLLSRWQRS